MLHLACGKAIHEGDNEVFDMRVFASAEVHFRTAERSPLSHHFEPPTDFFSRPLRGVTLSEAAAAPLLSKPPSVCRSSAQGHCS